MTAIPISNQSFAARSVNWGRFLWLPLILSAALLIIPQYSFIEASFHADIGFGQVSEDWSLASYREIFTNATYLNSLWRTIFLAVGATFISLVLGFPTALAISRLSGTVATILLGAVVAISLVTVVIKILGLILLLGPQGPINQALMWLGLISDPIRMTNNDLGVLIGLIQYALPLVILTLFSVAQTIPVDIEEAAQGLGATASATFRQVIMPIAKPGLAAAALVSFNMCMGAFTSPALLGGGRVLTLPVLIRQKMIDETAYSLGAALSLVLVLIVFVINIVFASYVLKTRKTARKA